LDSSIWESADKIAVSRLWMQRFSVQRPKVIQNAEPITVNTKPVNGYNIHVAIAKQRNYLEQILEIQDSDPRAHLRRGGIVDKIRR
jgi:hypothetical protein